MPTLFRNINPIISNFNVTLIGIGTCASMFTTEVQFGHAGSCANSDMEQATAKNAALREAGAYVPDSFDDLGDLIK